MVKKTFYPRISIIENGLEKILEVNRKLKPIGYNIFAEFYGVKVSYIPQIKPIIEKAIEKSKLNTIEKEIYHQFFPEGVTVLIPLKESHIAVHSWPEEEYLIINISACGKKAKKKAEIAYNVFKKYLSPNKIQKKVIYYGLE